MKHNIVGNPVFARLVSIARHYLLLLLLFAGGLIAWHSESDRVLAAEHQPQPSSPPPSCTGAYHKAFFGSIVVVNSGEVICSNITAFGGKIIIQGLVRGDVVAFGSDLIINGHVDGQVTTYGSNVAMQSDARVNGDIRLCGGHWFSGPQSQLHGSVLECTKSVGLLVISDLGPDIRFWSLLTWLVLSVLLTVLLPEHVMLVRTTATTKTRRSLVLGLLSVLLAPAVLAVLIALIVSIPLAIIIFVGLLTAWTLGTVAIGWHIGAMLFHKFAPQHRYNTRLVQVVVGITVLTLAGSIPYIGWLVSLFSGLLGLGAVLLSRFGTRLYSQPKHPLPL
ncbi:polymer-forming cytoskeletal protein [Ktedonobacter sp. SOSP1-85]|uniref:polymer-forming cytoskeletal protein n=1 Tax=Ktedonobacter sp. SOSP1-85 TaxID=2778367 RepID=UPI001915736E|nr:polymer-forming cytoskeletal protein [Ktedonobacter sp. SOSP1-85]